MPELSSQQVTRILNQAAAGDAGAAARLMPLVYDELRQIARRRMGRIPPGNTLTPTALVHEAYVKLVEQEDMTWESRSHFFIAASRAMRNILVDQARRKATDKHGGAGRRLGLNVADLAIRPPAEDVVALDEALKRLEHEEPEIGEIVTLHHFTGLTMEEVAEILRVSASTVKRRWRYARAWLHRALSGDDTAGQERKDGC